MSDIHETPFPPAARMARPQASPRGGRRAAAKHVPLLVAVLLAALALAPAAAQDAESPVTLLSNVGQPRRSSVNFQSPERAQGFTTGPNLKGYALANIEIGFNSVDGGGSITVSLWSDSGGKPGEQAVRPELTPPGSPGPQMHQFAAPSEHGPDATDLLPRAHGSRRQ